MAAMPHEGCALLIGNKKQKYYEKSLNEVNWVIDVIWPCCNIWQEQDIFGKNQYSLPENKCDGEETSKNNRFLIDPEEQLFAQKWARSRNSEILGSAHSYPNSEAIPSLIDLNLSFSYKLMLIIDQYGTIRAWWITNMKQAQEIQISLPAKKINKHCHK